MRRRAGTKGKVLNTKDFMMGIRQELGVTRLSRCPLGNIQAFLNNIRPAEATLKGFEDLSSEKKLGTIAGIIKWNIAMADQAVHHPCLDNVTNQKRLQYAYSQALASQLELVSKRLESGINTPDQFSENTAFFTYGFDLMYIRNYFVLSKLGSRAQVQKAHQLWLELVKKSYPLIVAEAEQTLRKTGLSAKEYKQVYSHLMDLEYALTSVPRQIKMIEDGESLSDAWKIVGDAIKLDYKTYAEEIEQNKYVEKVEGLMRDVEANSGLDMKKALDIPEISIVVSP